MIEPMVIEKQEHGRTSEQDDIKSTMAAILSCLQSNYSYDHIY